MQAEMSMVFGILALIILGSAVAAMSLRNLIHCALCLVLTFVGLAGLYLSLHAEFVGLVQILVYVGAVAIVLVFTILLTHSGEVSGGVAAQSWLSGIVIGGLVAGVLMAAVGTSSITVREAGEFEGAGTRRIGEELMQQHVVPLEVMALLLTAALIGAVILAMQDRRAQ